MQHNLPETPPPSAQNVDADSSVPQGKDMKPSSSKLPPALDFAINQEPEPQPSDTLTSAEDKQDQNVGKKKKKGPPGMLFMDFTSSPDPQDEQVMKPPTRRPPLALDFGFMAQSGGTTISAEDNQVNNINKKKKKGPPSLIFVDSVPKAPSTLPEGGTFTTILNGEEWVVRAEDLKCIREIGFGAHGTVSTHEHVPSKAKIAVKRIVVTGENTRRLENELKACRQSIHCPYMVWFYGAMRHENYVWICMEAMDTSLDRVITICTKRNMKIPESVCGKIAFCVTAALDFMKENFSMTHRDVKPHNILANRQGEIKLCDYGVAGNVVLSAAPTIEVGSKIYLAPERVLTSTDAGIDVRADVWSLGITMVEIANLENPYKDRLNKIWGISPFDQEHDMRQGGLPALAEGQFSNLFNEFINECLKFDPKDRPRFQQLLEHPFIQKYKDSTQHETRYFLSSVVDIREGPQRAHGR